MTAAAKNTSLCSWQQWCRHDLQNAKDFAKNLQWNWPKENNPHIATQRWRQGNMDYVRRPLRWPGGRCSLLCQWRVKTQPDYSWRKCKTAHKNSGQKYVQLLLFSSLTGSFYFPFRVLQQPKGTCDNACFRGSMCCKKLPSVKLMRSSSQQTTPRKHWFTSTTYRYMIRAIMRILVRCFRKT